MKTAHLFIITFLLVALLPAQGKLKQESYWIYTYSNEMKDYRITAIDGDELVINNGNWDVKVPLAEIELIANPPKPGLLGQVLGGGLGGYCGLFVGMISGFIASTVIAENGVGNSTVVGVFAVAGLAAGVHYGSKFGGKLLKGQPETLVDMTMWTIEEKKGWIQNNLINSY